MRLITIVTNNGQQLIAEQRPQTAGFLFVILSIGLLGLVIYFVRVHAYRMLLLPALGFLVLFLLSRIRQQPTYQITVDQTTHQIVSEETSGGKTLSKTTTSAADLASAEMQFNRGARKIVLIHRDGTQSYPLGEQELQDEPDQYVVLNALRKAIGQVPAVPQ